MKRGIRIRPWITLMLVGAIASGARAQVAVAQETGGETGSTTDEKVVFTWGGTGEPSSLNPMSGYSTKGPVLLAATRRVRSSSHKEASSFI
jgi:hypothetical protein